MTQTMRLRSLKCWNEENEASVDEEVYVLVTVADLRPPVPGVAIPPLPNVEVFHTPVYKNMDDDDSTLFVEGPVFWGLGGRPAPIADPGHVAVAVTVMEEDNQGPGLYASLLRAQGVAALAATAGDPDPASRGRRFVSAIRDFMSGVNDFNIPVPFAFDDDHIGTEQLVLDRSDLLRTGIKDRELHVVSEEGDYFLGFRIKGEDRVSAGAPVSAAAQGGDQLDVVFADTAGAVNVMWVGGQGGWQGPAVLTAPGVVPAGAVEAPIGLGHQGDDQLDAVFVDAHGAVNVMWVGGGGPWAGPAPITGPGVAAVGTPIALEHQGPNQLDAVFVDVHGAVNVMWVIGDGGWNGPAALTAPGVAPVGAPVSLARQGPDQLDAVFVDDHGAVNVMWVVGGGAWAGPAALTPAGTAAPGTRIALEHQAPNQLDAVFVGVDGAVHVMWVVDDGAWAGPAALTAPGAAPAGGSVSLAHQGADQLDAVYVDNQGALTVLWVVGSGAWSGPAAVTGGGAARPGAPVAVGHQGSNQLDAFLVDGAGGVTVSWVADGGGWSGPVRIS
jgi:hypothetical protein